MGLDVFFLPQIVLSGGHVQKSTVLRFIFRFNSVWEKHNGVVHQLSPCLLRTAVDTPTGAGMPLGRTFPLAEF